MYLCLFFYFLFICVDLLILCALKLNDDDDDECHSGDCALTVVHNYTPRMSTI